MNIELSPKIIFKRFIYFILFLLCADILGIIFKFYFGHDYVYGFVPLFNLDTEGNIPTLYSSFALLLSSALLSLIALTHKKNNNSYLSWAGLALIFLFLSIDEIASIHEKFGSATRDYLHTSGLLFFAWVIPYGVFLLVFLIGYLRFLSNLPRNIMILFVVSGVIFVSGAVGFELVGGQHFELYRKHTLLYCVYYTCEELLEMLGIVIFIYTLLTYIVSQFGVLRITISKKE